MTPLDLTHQFDMIFTTSFKHTGKVLYEVEFSNSNVLEIIEKLNELKYRVENNISTGKHVGAQIDTNDVQLALNTLEKIIEHYMKITGLTELSVNTKTYKMISYVRDSERLNVKTVAKEVLDEVLGPEKKDKKLTREEMIKAGAEQKTLERRLDLLKKLGKS
jgi:hypothetical protein